MIAESPSTAAQDALLERHLAALLGDVGPGSLALLRRHLTWVELAAGETLMSQGEPGDAMYLSISGRLRVYIRDADGVERMVRELSRGAVIGEMSLYTDEPRSATVVAIRDSVLVRLARSEFGALLESGAQVSIALTRQLIRRLQSPPLHAPLARPVAIGVVPVTAGVHAPEFAQRLAGQLRRAGKVALVDAAAIDAALGEAGLAQRSVSDHDAQHRIGRHLDELEAAHDVVLLVADDGASEWTRRCTRRCDEMLLLADASRPPALHETEVKLLSQRPGRAEAAEILVLLHRPDLRCPSGTGQWLSRRPVAGHLHIRAGLDRDIARLARLLSRTAVGLVLAGGGARGCAHLGVVRALQERGIEIDCVGGTSIGSVMAALVASDQPLAEVTAVARRAFSVDPTGDFNLVPLLSLIRGRRLRGTISAALDQLFGRAPDIDDLWKTCFCIASNFSQAREQRIHHGELSKALLASIAIPGALPPVLHDGDLLCDGGTFNNFPVDVMREVRGVGQVIGVDLGLRKPRRFEYDEVPGGWALLRDRLRPRASRRYKFPSLVAYLMNVTILYSASRRQEAERMTDLYFNPPLERVGMLQWKKFDNIVAQGHAHGAQVLDALPPDRLKRFATGAA